MTFPRTLTIVDSFDRANGALGGDWVNGALSQELVVIVDRAASGNINGPAMAMWKAPFASAVAVYQQIRVLSLTMDVMGCGFASDPVNATQNIAVSLVPQPTGDPLFQLDYTLGTAGSTTTPFSPGDWTAAKWDVDAKLMSGWTYRSPHGPWTKILGDFDASGVSRLAPNGWLAYMQVGDDVEKVELFGAEAVPSANPVPLAGFGAMRA